MTEVPHLLIERVSKRFGATAVLRDVSLSIPKGRFVALLGPSGCGKSTLLKIIAGLEAATSGQLALAGRSLAGVPTHKRDIGIVFQSYALFPHMSVRDNVRFGLDMRHVSREEAHARVAEALGFVHLDGYGDRMPAQLSGGQQQRVALARSLAIRPHLLLLDEPLSNLDAVLRKTVRVDIRELHDRMGTTTVMVTHDQEEAMSMADTVAVMGGGRILQEGSPEAIYERPASAEIARFVGNPPAALLPCRTDGAGWHVADIAWAPADLLAARLSQAGLAEISLGLRAEAVSLVSPGTVGALPGTVVSSEYLGGERRVYATIGSVRVAVATTAAAPPTGTPIGLLPDSGSAMLFRTDGMRIDP